MRIPAVRPVIGEEEQEAVRRVLASGNLAQGPEVAAFEAEFSSIAVSGRQCVAVNSGTSALHLALLSLGVGAGDEVIVPSFTFAATANAVALTGATPIFADIDSESFCLDVRQVERALTPRTRAIVPVHLYGHPADMKALCSLAERCGLLIVEDAAQAHLAAIDGRPVGTWGDVAAFSFYPTKNMTSGEGGMIVTDDAGVAKRARLLRNQGQEVRYRNEIIGLNNRMTDIQAAIGRVQLAKLRGWTQKRTENASRYNQLLKGVELPTVAAGCEHVYHQYTIRVESNFRDELVRALAERGIGTGVYYPVPVHQLPAHALDLSLVTTESAAASVISLPVYPQLTDPDLVEITCAINDFVEHQE